MGVKEVWIYGYENQSYLMWEKKSQKNSFFHLLTVLNYLENSSSEANYIQKILPRFPILEKKNIEKEFLSSLFVMKKNGEILHEKISSQFIFSVSPNSNKSAVNSNKLSSREHLFPTHQTGGGITCLHFLPTPPPPSFLTRLKENHLPRTSILSGNWSKTEILPETKKWIIVGYFFIRKIAFKYFILIEKNIYLFLIRFADSTIQIWESKNQFIVEIIAELAVQNFSNGNQYFFVFVYFPLNFI